MKTTEYGNERSGIFKEIHRQSWHSRYYQRLTPTGNWQRNGFNVNNEIHVTKTMGNIGGNVSALDFQGMTLRANGA